MDFKQDTDLTALLKLVNSNSGLDFINAISLKRSGFLQTPIWSTGNKPKNISIAYHDDMSADDVENKILNCDINIQQGPLVSLDLVKCKEGKNAIILSAHHALFDQKGLVNLLRKLDGNYTSTKHGYIPKKQVVNFLKQLADTIQVTFFLLWKPARSLAKLMPPTTGTLSKSKYHLIKFDKEETKQLDKIGIKNGAVIGKSPFYLAATTRALHQILIKRGHQNITYWIPVPQDQRPRGADGSLLSNQLSFLFYKIPSEQLISLDKTISFIANQMKEQVRKNIPGKYASLMSLFRRLPLSLYLTLIKLPTAGAISSFSFSDLGEEGDRLQTFNGWEVEDLINYPPNPGPPGFTVVFMRFQGTLRVVIGYVEEAVNPEEIAIFENNLKNDLLTGKLL